MGVFAGEEVVFFQGVGEGLYAHQRVVGGILLDRLGVAEMVRDMFDTGANPFDLESVFLSGGDGFCGRGEGFLI